MLSIIKLFEATYALPAQAPMAGVRQYMDNKIASLKQAFARGAIGAVEFNQQMVEIRRNKNNKKMGVTQF